jgi:hypothetical protein
MNKFSTFLVTCLKNGLTYHKFHSNGKAIIHKSFNPETMGINGMCSPERRVRLKQALEQMGSLAIDVVNTIFQNPAVSNKKDLRTHLRLQGVSDQKAITNAFNEISKTLEEV